MAELSANRTAHLSLRVLFVDDEKPLQEFMRTELPRLGHEITVCADGRAAMKALEKGTFDVLILDELTYPLTFGWLDTPAVLAAIAGRPKGTHVVVTGRDAPAALIDAADLVTEMRVIKHPYRDRGLGAQAGIEL